MYKKEIVKSRLLNILGITELKIHARKCEIRIVDKEITKGFLNKNNLYGYKKSDISIGLYYKDDLVYIITLNKRNNKWTIDRFCSILNSIVIGGFSKLLKFFELNYKPKEITAVLNRDWSDEQNVFNKNKFIYVSHTSVSKWSVEKNKNIRKKSTTKQCYYIYDCGQIKYKKIYEVL